MNILNYKKHNSERLKQTVTAVPMDSEFMKLFESEVQQLDIKYPEVQNQEQLETIMSVKSKQFSIGNGMFMGNILYPVDSRFSLYWHAKNTNNFDEFIQSVNEMSKAGCNQELSNDVIIRLQKEYDKYINKFGNK